MGTAQDTGFDHGEMRALEARVAQLEARVSLLEAVGESASSPRRARASAPRGEGDAATALSGSGWTEPYPVAQLEVSETWIELHEVSARPQLQRLIRQVIETEGPVTDRLVLDRVRRAWGLQRAGGRVAEAFDQAVRQLLARGLVERDHDALVEPGRVLHVVRVPGADQATRRGAEDVPLGELALAIGLGARISGPVAEGELTMAVAKLLGWTRRGGAIQERLDAALVRAETDGMISRAGGRITAVGDNSTL